MDKKPLTPAQMKRRTPYIVASSRWGMLKRGDHVMVESGMLLVGEQHGYLTEGWRGESFSVRLDEAAIGMSIARKELQIWNATLKLEQKEEE